MSYQGKKCREHIGSLEKQNLTYEEQLGSVAPAGADSALALWQMWYGLSGVNGQRNFMGGISYGLNPLETMKMITASSVFGEPQYYRDGKSAQATIFSDTFFIDHARGIKHPCDVDPAFVRYSLSELDPYLGLTTAQVMEKAIDEALSFDFEATLLWAQELRERYLMRLNPQVILVRAAIHPDRHAYTEAHPGEFARIAQRVMSRGDDVIHQVQYWLAVKGSKRSIPPILKRTWAQRVATMDAYAMAKYGQAGIGLVDVVRICHAKGTLVDTLMREGAVPMPEGQDTWERLRASGMGWKDILNTIRVPHMALLRNLRGIFSEVFDPKTRTKALETLKRGVRGGKQYPFRYLSAWKAIVATTLPYADATVNDCLPQTMATTSGSTYPAHETSWQPQVQRALEECIDIACENLPNLRGRCAFLTDNSGSAWGTCPSEWGTMKIAEIGNLSSVIGAMRADEGYVFPFGDSLKSVAIAKERGVLEQTNKVTQTGKTCGMTTENGIWLFFRHAIHERQHWDNIFVYSDMQAGHGGLYGIDPSEYRRLGASIKDGPYIDVNKLVQIYRNLVNPKVNVFCIQIAGYTNALVPEYGYRTAILYGWCGRELAFADAMGRTWDEVETRCGRM